MLRGHHLLIRVLISKIGRWLCSPKVDPLSRTRFIWLVVVIRDLMGRSYPVYRCAVAYAC
jgi:hypothetical protein